MDLLKNKTNFIQDSIKSHNDNNIPKYIGINLDEKIEQKIMISEKNIKKNSYFPALSLKHDKTYQLIATS
jgi:hypothetical protein